MPFRTYFLRGFNTTFFEIFHFSAKLVLPFLLQFNALLSLPDQEFHTEQEIEVYLESVHKL